MRVLSLDLGSTTGFAYYAKEYGICSGTLSFKHKGKFSDEGFMTLYLFLRIFKRAVMEERAPIEIIVEQPHAGRFMAPLRVLFGLLAIVHMFCFKHGVKLTEYSPKAIKKFATGNGNADKAAMVRFIQKNYPKVKDHNEADSLAMLHMHLEKKV